MGLTAFEERAPTVNTVQILPATTTTRVDLTAVTTYTQRIDNIIASNGDSIAHSVNLYMVTGATIIGIGGATLPAGKGQVGSLSADLLADGVPPLGLGLILPPGYKLEVNVDVTLTTSAVSLCALGGLVLA